MPEPGEPTVGEAARNFLDVLAEYNKYRYPEDETGEDVTLIDKGVSEVFNSFPRDSWRQAVLMDVVRAALKGAGVEDD